MIAILSVVAMTAASPTAKADIDTAQLQPEERGLEKRESHQANLYTQIGCVDGYISSVYNFNCGGHCYTYSQGVAAVYLEYSGSGKYPTANCYTSSDCSGNVNTHSGVGSGSHSCTSQHNVVRSCYFYYGC